MKHKTILERGGRVSIIQQTKIPVEEFACYSLVTEVVRPFCSAVHPPFIKLNSHDLWYSIITIRLTGP